MNSSKTKKYQCLEEGCNASYSKYCRFQIHKAKHTGERPFICDAKDCDKAYTNMAHLKRHKCLVHEKSGEVSCTAKGCGQVFNNKYSLKKHINQQHSENVNILYKCDQCSQKFKKKRLLKEHLHYHEEKDSLRCSLCNISFGSLHLYNKHNKRVHKIHTCDCGLTFNKWTLFCEHRKTSCKIEKVEHKCVICNKVFTTQSNLRAHSLCHVEESQRDDYHCPYLNCQRSYKYKKNLNYHISTYHERSNDDVEIKCTEEGCNVVFKSKKNLKQHILKIHGGLPKKTEDRQPRKDKGTRKKCMASVMSGLPLPPKEHIAIIKQSNKINTTSNIQESLSKRTSEKADNGDKLNSEENMTANGIRNQQFAQISDNQMCSTEFLNVEESLNHNQICETLKCL